MTNIGILLFGDFETLDVFGPVEIFGRLKNLYKIEFFSQNGGLITSSHNTKIITEKLPQVTSNIDILLIPGGYGTRVEVNNDALIDQIKAISLAADNVLTVCTGAALLAKTGLLNFKEATTNKRAFDWVILQGENVNWLQKARWAVAGKYYTSAGVSAGMDMTLGFLSDKHGLDFARKVAYEIEYSWYENKDLDEFWEQNFT